MSPEKTTLDALRIDRTATPRRQSRGWLFVLILLLVIAAGAIWWIKRPGAIEVRTVTVQESTSGSGPKTLLNASGYVTARRIATVSSKVAGKVMEVLVEEGMKVEAGQILARIDASNVEKSLNLAIAQLDSARKALDETRANLERAERDLRRITELAAEKISTQADLDRAGAESRSLSARLAKQTADIEVADREVAVWRQQLDDTVVRAPFPGIVTTKNAQPGEMISPMSAAGGFTRTGICTIVDMQSLEIEVDVSESYINRVEPGQIVAATLDSYADWIIPAKVIAIIPTADRQKATVKVRVGFEKLDPRILPDMGVKVAFQASASGASSAPSASKISVPKSALRQREGRDVVWIVADGRVERRAVTIAGTLGEEVVIAAGLSPGERIVVEPSENLNENTRVTELKP